MSKQLIIRLKCKISKDALEARHQAYQALKEMGYTHKEISSEIIDLVVDKVLK